MMNQCINSSRTDRAARLRLTLFVAAALVVFVFGSIVEGQQTSVQTPDANQLTYFDFLFARIANIDSNPSDLQRRQLAFADKLSLSPQERNALARSVAIYTKGLKDLRATVTSMTGGSPKPVGLSKAQTDSLASQRLSTVNTAASAFLSSLSASSRARLDSIVQPINQ
jgi:hypothetical protein